MLRKSKIFVKKMVNQKLLAAGLMIAPCYLSTLPAFASYLEVKEDAEFEISDYHISTEEHSLLDVVGEDLAFLKKYPTNVMTAAQIIYAMILDQGMETKHIAGYGHIPVYHLFSKNNPVSEGRQIVGQFEGIKAVVDGIEAQARGSKAGVKVPLLVGIHGTGKSEFRTVIANALKNMTRKKEHEKFHVHEISWQIEALKDIPGVGNYIKTIQEEEFRSPLHSSPISILPTAYKKAIKKLSEEIIAEMIGPYPVFDMDPDPISKYVRDHILNYYMTSKDEYVTDRLEVLEIVKSKSGRFSALDEIKILDQYVKIRRVILGDPGTVPLIDAQGDDIDYQGLIMSENPVFRMLAGPTNVWSWNYNGAVLSGSRNFIFLDEFFRNDPALRDLFLGILESRVVSRGGSPAVPIDSVIIAATNSANLDKAKADTKSLAQVNRMRQIPFEWTTQPGEIAKILLYMNGKGLKMSKLESGDLESQEIWEEQFDKIDVDLLFPEMVNGKPMQTADGRYKLIYGETEEDGVFIAPHSLIFMADFIATTRMNTSVKSAQALKGGEQIIGDPIFKDPLTRLKVLKNEVNILTSQQKELYKLSKKLREGSYGLSSRVAGTWFAESLIEARQPGNDHTLTPIILRKVYDRLLNEGTLEVDDIPTELKWKALMDTVAEGVLIPKLHNDIYSSFHNDGKAADIYQEIIQEIVTLVQDPQATIFEFNKSTMSIDRERLESVGKIYQKKTGKPLAFQQLAMFYLGQMTRKEGKPRKNKELMEAISEYLATSLDKYISVKDLLEFAEKNTGGKDVSEKFRSVESILIHKLGYNKRSIIDALRIIKQYKEKLEH